MKSFDLSKGLTYHVVREFTDFEGRAIPQGQRLTFLSQAFDVATGYYLLAFKERKLCLKEEAGRRMAEHLADYLALAAPAAQPVAEHEGSGVRCPNCSARMTLRPVTLFYRPHPVEVDVCMSCNLLWFDRSECISMTARSVLDLFQLLNQSGAKPRLPVSVGTKCPHCRNTLELTHDMQRATRFSYWRCPGKHGELYTFTQFLLNKNFVRSPSQDDLAKLRKLVRQISCTQCGAPVDLIKDTTCSYCNTAVTLVDPDGIAKAVRELAASERQRDATAAEAAARAALATVENEALSKRYNAGGDVPGDLLSAAMGALIAFLAT